MHASCLCRYLPKLQMEQYFLQKYQNKTRDELQRIVANKGQYQPAAVSAAIQLLNENREKQIQLPQEKITEQVNVEDSNFGTLSLSFDYRPFFRALSYREFLTTIAMALLFQAFFEIIDYYSSERFFENTHKAWKGYGILVVFLANHILYRYEHRRSNNFIGRSLNDLLLIITLIFVRTTYEFILKGTYSISIDGSGVGLFFMILAILMFIFAFEVGVAFLKYLLKRLRCQIF
mgnify:CR=1 FL=1